MTSDRIGPPRRLLIVGAPGSGKGTQSARLSEHFAIPAISTGDVFRAELKANTPLGLRVREFVQAGKFVPDHVTNDVVEDRLRQPDCAAGFLLDGYPRTEAQVTRLDELLAQSGRELDGVILLESDHRTLIDRLEHRASKTGRADDRIDVILRRIELYEAQTAPVAALYEQRGLLARVDANLSPDDVFAAIIRELPQVVLVTP